MTQSAGAAPYEGAVQTNRQKKVWIRLLKTAVVVLIFAFLGRHLWMLIRDWTAQEDKLRGLSVSGGWLAWAAAAFLGGQILFAFFWYRLLHRCGADESRFDVLRAFSVGTLGKYVPGKACVVLVRTGMLPGQHISRFSIGLTAVYETLSMMAVGAVVASLCLPFARPLSWTYLGGAMIAAAGLLTGLHPWVFGRLAKMASVPFKGDGADFSARGCFATLGKWAILPIGGWLCLGMSLWAVTRSLDIPCATVADFAVLTGSAAAATAVGFLILFMPAGIGVRELILIQVLGPRIGHSQALVAALLLRTTWTLGEVLFGALMYLTPLLSARVFRRTSSSKTLSEILSESKRASEPATIDDATSPVAGHDSMTPVGSEHIPALGEILQE